MTVASPSDEFMARLKACGVSWEDGQAVRRLVEQEYAVHDRARVVALANRIIAALNEGAVDMNLPEVYAALIEALARVTLSSQAGSPRVVILGFSRAEGPGP